MKQPKNTSSANEIGDLIATAHEDARQQAEKAATPVGPQTSQPASTKRIVAALLLLACVGIAYIQYPKFQEPFGALDPNQDAAVAQSDIAIVASAIETYRVSQGKYPATLGEVRLPDVLADFVKEQGIGYRVTEKAYVLEWSLPKWRVLYDGEAGVATVDLRSGK